MVEQKQILPPYRYQEELTAALNPPKHLMRDEHGGRIDTAPDESYQPRHLSTVEANVTPVQQNLPGVDVELVQSGSEQRVA